MPLNCHSSSWDALPPLCLATPNLSLANASSPPGSRPCPPSPQSESGASGAPLHPAYLITVLGTIQYNCLFPWPALPSPAPHLPTPERAGRKAGSGFYCLYLGHVAQGSEWALVIWHFSKRLTLSTTIYRRKVMSLGCGSRHAKTQFQF